MSKETKTEISNNKAEELKKVLALIEKDLGKNSIMKLGDTKVEKIPVISSGSFLLDEALGVGGFPRGRIIEIYGPEQSGKTLSCLHLIAEAQRTGGNCAFIDAEHAFDRLWAKKNGVNVSELYFSQPNSGEHALTIVEYLLKSGTMDVIVVDSVAALTPQAELEGNMGDAQMALQARLMSQAMRKLTGLVSKSDCILVFINQLRCLHENTNIYTKDGMKYIKDIQKGDILIGCESSQIIVKEVVPSGEMEGFTLKTKYNPDIILSRTHKHAYLSEKGISYKEAEYFKKGDFVINPCIYADIPSDSKILLNLDKSMLEDDRLPKYLDSDLATFMGMFFADGCLISVPEKSHYCISFTENNKDRNRLVREMLVKLFGKVSNNKESNPGITVHGVNIFNFCKHIGLKSYGRLKDIPEIILTAPLDLVASFIRGMCFDSHGFDNNGFIITVENKNEAGVLSSLLGRLGIHGDVRTPKIDYHTNYIYITGSDAIEFNRRVGFLEKAKQEKASYFQPHNYSRGKYDVIPFTYVKFVFNILKKNKHVKLSSLTHYSAINACFAKRLNISRDRFIEFLEDSGASEANEFIKFLKNNRFFEVISCVKSGNSVSMWDIETDKSYFIANGQITHNSKIGIFFGTPETVTGGNALKFYASIRMDVRKKDVIKEGENVIGHSMKVKIVKNKVAPPFKEVLIPVNYTDGFDAIQEIINISVDKGLITKAGSWFSYKEERIGQGISSVKEYMKKNPELLEQFKEIIRKDITLCDEGENNA